MSLVEIMDLDDILALREAYRGKYMRNKDTESEYLSILVTINGYHHFRVKPHIGIDLLLTAQREPLDAFDGNPIKFVMPPLSEVKLDMLGLCVRAKAPLQTVSDIVGKAVGLVPASMSAILSKFLDEKNIEFFAVYTGLMQHGRNINLGEGSKLIYVFCAGTDFRKHRTIEGAFKRKIKYIRY